MKQTIRKENQRNSHTLKNPSLPNIKTPFDGALLPQGEGCCEASWQQTGLATLAASCRAANFTISDACSDDTGLPYATWNA